VLAGAVLLVLGLAPYDHGASAVRRDVAHHAAAHGTAPSGGERAAANRPAHTSGTARSPHRAAALPAGPAPGHGTDCTRAKCVALTFDDGPGRDTAALLDVLDRYHAQATFFVLGGNAAAEPALLRRMLAEGHEIGDHTYGHRNLTLFPAAEVRAQLVTTADVIARATGRRPTLTGAPSSCR